MMPFASAVTYFQEYDLDLNAYLRPHPQATYFLRMEGDSLQQAGIFNGDILVVDRAQTATPGSLIIAEFNGELTARRYQTKGKQIFLGTDDCCHPPYRLREEDSFAVWGVITSVIRKLC